jgi:hypothetical protein
MAYISGAEAIGFEPLSPNEPGGPSSAINPVLIPPISNTPIADRTQPQPPDYSDYIIIEFGPPSVFDEGFDLIDQNNWPGFVPSDPLNIPPWNLFDPSQMLWELERILKPEPPPGYYPDEARLKQMYIDHWNVPELHVPGQSSGDVFFV